MPEREETYQVIVSKRAAQQLIGCAAFAAKLEERLAHQLVRDFRAAAASLRKFPYRNPVLRSDVFSTEKYRKMVFDKWHLLIYQIKGEKVYIEYVIDGRQDHQWLFEGSEAYEDMVETAEADAAITEAEAELEKDGQLHDARTALASLRRKHFG